MCFQGPFVIIDELMTMIAQCTLPDPPAPSETSINGVDDMETDQTKRGVKRASGNDSDDEGSTVAPPSNDIYRSRQQKRIH